MNRIKICGITNIQDALRAASLGAWALGFVFYKKSPRCLGAYKARDIIASLPPFVTPVGVFVNQKEGAVKDIADFCGLRVLQFHGDESPAYCKRFKKQKVIKAFRIEKKVDVALVKSYDCSAYLFDTYQAEVHGGTGKVFDWEFIKGAKNLSTPIILSGGLHYNNVREAIEAVRPYAVDVSSGVEQSPGKKSERSLKNLFAAADI